MKQSGQQVLITLARDRSALFYLLKFVEKQYPVLKNSLSIDYLVLHFESSAYLKSPEAYPKASYRDFYTKIFSAINAALQSPAILETARVALQQFNQDANLSTATDIHFFALQNTDLIPLKQQPLPAHQPENIHDAIAAASAITYLSQQWHADDVAAALKLQQELLCLQAWLTNLKNQSWSIHSQFARQQLLCVEKSQFAKCFYQSPALAQKTWQDLHQFCAHNAQDALKIIKDKITQIENLISEEEENLKKHPCTSPSGKDIIYFHRNEIYYTLFPPTLKSHHNHFLLPWLFSASMLALYQFLEQGLSVNHSTYATAETKMPWLVNYAIDNMTHAIEQNSCFILNPHYKPFP